MSCPILVTLGRFWPPLVKNMPAERKKEMVKIQEFTAVGCCALAGLLGSIFIHGVL